MASKVCAATIEEKELFLKSKKNISPYSREFQLNKNNPMFDLFNGSSVKEKIKVIENDSFAIDKNLYYSEKYNESDAHFFLEKT